MKRILIAAALCLSLVASAAPTSAFAGGESDRVLALVNAYRREHGLDPVARDATLEQAAQAHAEAMAKSGRLSHDGPDGTLAQRMVRAGYAYAVVAEDLGSGTRTPDDSVATWEQSPPHARNLLVPSVTQAGVGHAAATDGEALDYWSLILAKPAEP